MRNLGWSWKVPTVFQTRKYLPENLVRYCSFLSFIQNIPFHRIKCLDEAHFVARNIRTKLVWSLVNQRAYTRNFLELNEPNASVTFLIGTDRGLPVKVSFRTESNTQYDFVSFVEEAIAEGFLVNGDFLLMDNAAIHHGDDTWDYFTALLQNFNIQLLNTPTYSPELNPTELVINMVKSHMRRCESPTKPLILKFVEAVAEVTNVFVFNSYNHCFFPNVILPEIRLY